MYTFHAPVFVRNKFGRTAAEHTLKTSVKMLIQAYRTSEHNAVQKEYEELRLLSSQ